MGVIVSIPASSYTPPTARQQAETRESQKHMGQLAWVAHTIRNKRFPTLMQWEARYTLKGIMGFPHTHCSKHVLTLKHSNICTHVYMHMCFCAHAWARAHIHTFIHPYKEKKSITKAKIITNEKYTKF